MGKIDLDFYKDITTKAHNEGIGAITLASRGEPTLHPQLETMVRHLDDKFIEKKINTNVTRLTDTLNRAILESGLIISFLVVILTSRKSLNCFAKGLSLRMFLII